jgi:hypothetical protein
VSDNDAKAAAAHSEARALYRKAWFWRLNAPPCVAAYVAGGRWREALILYLVLVSIWALVDTNVAAAKAAAAKAAGYENP